MRKSREKLNYRKNTRRVCSNKWQKKGISNKISSFRDGEVPRVILLDLWRICFSSNNPNSNSNCLLSLTKECQVSLHPKWSKCLLSLRLLILCLLSLAIKCLSLQLSLFNLRTRWERCSHLFLSQKLSNPQWQL